MDKIKEIIVVEGKSDIIAVKRAFEGNVDVVATHGLGLDEKLLNELVLLQEKRGLIILTDPDYAGKRISNIIREYVPNAKFASISRKSSTKNSNVGVENASDEAIIEAINRARPSYTESKERFTQDDIIDNKLAGLPNSKDRRIALCEKLGITYCNAKQLLIRLNSFEITREEFNKAIEEIGD
ncbi:ribonuclease M5 [Helcococcus kunzii]|uniref:ribonuclease M5 n=1 Tax=Helcococcus kunzii TaxID=40091 RepID=UPI0024ACB846|nr:ribonuclease M5 [Helcococcus kunzii]